MMSAKRDWSIYLAQISLIVREFFDYWRRSNFATRIPPDSCISRGYKAYIYTFHRTHIIYRHLPRMARPWVIEVRIREVIIASLAEPSFSLFLCASQTWESTGIPRKMRKICANKRVQFSNFHFQYLRHSIWINDAVYNACTPASFIVRSVASPIETTCARCRIRWNRSVKMWEAPHRGRPSSSDDTSSDVDGDERPHSGVGFPRGKRYKRNMHVRAQCATLFQQTRCLKTDG